MKKKYLLLILGYLAIAILIYFLLPVTYFGDSTLDIHLHDTFFVIDYGTIIFLVVMLLLFVVSLINSIKVKFRSWIWVIIFSTSAIILGYYLFYLIKFFFYI